MLVLKIPKGHKENRAPRTGLIFEWFSANDSFVIYDEILMGAIKFMPFIFRIGERVETIHCFVRILVRGKLILTK